MPNYLNTEVSLFQIIIWFQGTKKINCKQLWLRVTIIYNYNLYTIIYDYMISTNYFHLIIIIIIIIFIITIIIPNYLAEISSKW